MCTVQCVVLADRAVGVSLGVELSLSVGLLVIYGCSSADSDFHCGQMDNTLFVSTQVLINGINHCKLIVSSTDCNTYSLSQDLPTAACSQQPEADPGSGS